MGVSAASGPLGGRGIVVTRPAHQAAQLARLITGAGGNPILFPTIEIIDVADARPVAALIDRLDAFDIAIFISPNAAARGMRLIQARRELPRAIRVAAIGSAGVAELERCGVVSVIAPGRFDSEALLDLAEMQDVAGKRIVIFRGEGGREVLGDTLTARGATIEYAACYRRVRTQADCAPLAAAWTRGELDAVTVTSSEGLRNLYDIVGEAGRKQLLETPLFVPHRRIERTARDLGFATVVLTAQGDAGLVDGLTRWFERK